MVSMTGGLYTLAGRGNELPTSPRGRGAPPGKQLVTRPTERCSVVRAGSATLTSPCSYTFYTASRQEISTSVCPSIRINDLRRTTQGMCARHGMVGHEKGFSWKNSRIALKPGKEKSILSRQRGDDFAVLYGQLAQLVRAPH